MTRIFVRVLASIVLLAASSQCAKILVFVCQVAKSHHLVMHPIIKELAIRGHEIDFYTHHKIPNAPKTLRHIELEAPNSEDIFRTVVGLFENSDKPFPLHKLTKALRDMKLADILPPCSKSDQMKELLASNRTYDMVIGEFAVWQEDLAVLLHRFKAPGVALQTFPDHYWVNELSRAPHNPSYMVPSVTQYSTEMSFFERLDNLWSILLANMVDYYYVLGPQQWAADKELRYDGWESRPSIFQLASDMALILTSNHHSLGYPFPRAPHVKDVMGTNIDYNPSPLPKDLQEFMDGAEHGVIYFSLGSIANIDFLKKKQILNPILETLSSLKQRILWKWTSHDGDEPPIVPNIKFSKWLPQQSILAHPNLKLFMTHGGLGSLTEAVYNGVPLIGFPIFADQYKNVKLLVHLGLGKELNLNKLTKEDLKLTLDEVQNNPKYKEEMLKRSAMFKDRPMKPVEEAVYWIEYVLRYGNVLQPASVHIPIYQFYLLDIIGFIAVCAGIILYLSCCLLRALIRLLKNITHQRSDKPNLKKVN